MVYFGSLVGHVMHNFMNVDELHSELHSFRNYLKFQEAMEFATNNFKLLKKRTCQVSSEHFKYFDEKLFFKVCFNDLFTNY